MTNLKGISKLKKEKANEIRLETELINQYKDAISTLFKTVSFEMDSLGNKNSFYYSDSISVLSNLFTKELKSNRDFKTVKEIEIFNRTTIDLLKDIVQFFIAIDNYNSQDNKVVEDIILFKTNIEDGFKNLGQFDLKIKDYFSKKDSSIAMKEYCFNIIKESFYFLNNRLYIDIEKCPLKSDYNNLINILEHSIDYKEFDSQPKLNSINKSEKIPDKWYALLYWFELITKGEKLPKKIGGNYDKSKIIQIGIEKCNNSGEYFYKYFIGIDISDEKLLKGAFGEGWKEKIIKLSNNNSKISKYIKEKYKI